MIAFLLGGALCGAGEPDMQTYLVDQVSNLPERGLVDLDYYSRLEMMRNYAGVYGYGYVSAVGFGEQNYGLWGATDILTRWQLNSGRGVDPHWRIPNAEISVIPSVLLREYQLNPGQPCSESPWVRLASTGEKDPSGHTDRVDLCKSWKRYFGTQHHDSPENVQAAYWRAHMKALHFAFNHYKPEMLAYKAPQPELDYWKGYIRLIEIFSHANGPTNDALNYPFFKYSLPMCSPLGSPQCRVEDLPTVSRHYVEMIIALGNGSCDRRIGLDCEALLKLLMGNHGSTQALWDVSVGAVGAAGIASDLMTTTEELTTRLLRAVKAESWSMPPAGWNACPN